MPPSAAIGPHLIDFPPFQLDLRGGILRRQGVPVALRPKTFAVLQHLAEHPGELVSKQALLDAVWGDVAVTEEVVRLSIFELRVALRDDRANPRFIETVPRRGYRFVAATGAPSRSPSVPTAATTGEDASWPGIVVGRARERAEIAAAFHDAASARRQVIFVSGEAGIGKTTLVDIALDDRQRATGPPPLIGCGQCIEQYGGGEPYLPVLEALAAVRRGSDGRHVETVLARYAPDWLLRVLGLPLSGIVPTASTHQHTLHQLAASIDALSAETPLVLVLEDVHWSDHATLDLLSVLAQRRGPARLLILCTLRPADAIARGHPVATVKRELLRKGLCRELLLGGLSAADVATYLAARFPGAELPRDLLPLLVDRSDGNPFTVAALLDHLLERGLLVTSGLRWELRAALAALRTAIPDGIRAVIEPRLQSLRGDTLRVLEAASVAGPEFAAHAVASTAPRGSDLADVEYVEQLCDELAGRHEIVRAAGESAWPDGTTTARYAFVHALYRDVVYQSLSSSTRRRLHRAIGERLEHAQAGRTEEVAGELAAHFEHGGDAGRAVRYRGEAAAHARSRFAYQEARVHLDAALVLLRRQPDTIERQRQEIRLLHDLGSTLFSIKGHGDEDAARAFARMRELAEHLDDAALRLRAMEGLVLVHTMRAELAIARELAEQMIVLARQLPSPPAVANARVTLGAVLFFIGELEAARRHGEDVRALSDPEAFRLASVFGVSSSCLLAAVYTHVGSTARARAMIREAHARATAYGVPYFRGQATNITARLSAVLRDATMARVLALEALQIATEYGFAVFRIEATMVLGWCDVEEGRVAEGLAAFRDAFGESRATESRITATTFSVLLAEAYLRNGDVAAAEQVVNAARALVAETGGRAYEAELHRVQGECLRSHAATRSQKDEAATCFERALTIATRDGAALFELRAATSLFRLRGRAARERLVQLVDRFETRDDCADLRAARALLAG
jgi:DNA-binding winged helix-turn-helix (wHTH) protein/tetratricopeptide (TPR) repeat protein